MRACFWILMVTGALLMAVSGLVAADRCEPPDEMLLDYQGYKSDRKGPVPFSHEDHAEDYEIACTECHHEYKDGKNVWTEEKPVKKCVECHHPMKSEGKVKKLKLAYHKNCRNCHKAMVKSGASEDAPYRKCGDCHQDKE